MSHSEDEIRRSRKAYAEYTGNPEFAIKGDPRKSGNWAIVQERKERIQELLRVHGFWLLEPLHILDVGCGTGGMLAQLESWEAKPENLAGIDLIPERVAKAQELYPHLHFICGNASEMDFPQATFDLFVAFTLFSSILSSILDEQMAQAVAARIWQVLRPGGAVLWYDSRGSAQPQTRDPTAPFGLPLGIADARALSLANLDSPFVQPLPGFTAEAQGSGVKP